MRFFLGFISLLLLISCDKKSKVEKAVEEIPIEVKVVRFEKDFFETKPNDLPNLKAEYPFFFPEGNDDKIWIEKMQNPLWRELYSEVEKRYSNFGKQTNEIEDLFKHIKYYFPKTKLIYVITTVYFLCINNNNSQTWLNVVKNIPNFDLKFSSVLFCGTVRRMTFITNEYSNVSIIYVNPTYRDEYGNRIIDYIKYIKPEFIYNKIVE